MIVMAIAINPTVGGGASTVLTTVTFQSEASCKLAAAAIEGLRPDTPQGTTAAARSRCFKTD